MNPQLWAVLTDLVPVGLATISLVVAAIVAKQAHSWRPRPFIQFRVDVSAGHIEKLDVEGFLDRAKTATSGVLMINAADFFRQPDNEDLMRQGYEFTIVNHGNAPAFDVEVHLDVPKDRSAAHLMLGDVVTIRRAQLLPGEEAGFILSDELKFGTAFKGRRRWKGKDVWGGAVQDSEVEIVSWVTWREPPKLSKPRRRELAYARDVRLGEWQ